MKIIVIVLLISQSLFCPIAMAEQKLNRNESVPIAAGSRVGSQMQESQRMPAPPVKPDAAPVLDESRDYFGQKISDPYAWMEQRTNDRRFVEYLKAQNTYTREVLDSIGAARQRLFARIKQLDSAVDIVRSWQRLGTRVFYLETPAGNPNTYLMVKDENGKAKRLFDPSKFALKGVHAAIDYYAPSFDGRYAVVALSLGGSENSTIMIVDVNSGRLLRDRITRAQYADPAWRRDSKSFYYSRLQELPVNAPKSAIYENQRVYLHVLGQNLVKDTPVFGAAVSDRLSIDKAGFVSVSTDPVSPYILASHSAGTSDIPVFYFAKEDEAVNSKTNWQQVVSKADKIAVQTQSNMTLHGSTMYLLAERKANRELKAINLENPDINKAETVIAESDRVLIGVFAASDALYITSKKGVDFFLQRLAYEAGAKPEDIALPYAGTIANVDTNPSYPGVLFRLESWIKSGQAYEYDPETKLVRNTFLVKHHPADFSGVEARELFATSADGAKIPLSVICLKNTKLDGSNPTIEVGYGAYGISVDPSFDPALLSWIERSGVIAVVHPRGGGEYGPSWHEAGKKATKQHTIDDMIAAARYLIDNRYTSPEHLAIKGSSAGGIACGGAITQHPELFAAAIDNVGMTDMLRFQTTQGGAANVPEFGDVNNAAEFKDLYAMSAYHHVKDEVMYPAVMGITGVNDPRVPSWIIAKMVARLQAATASDHPILLRVDFDAGHGLGSSRAQRQKQMTDEHSFLRWQLGDPEFQPAVDRDPFESATPE